MKNPKFRQALTDVIHAAGATGGAPKARGALLYQVAGKVRTHIAGCRHAWTLGKSLHMPVLQYRRMDTFRRAFKRLSVCGSPSSCHVKAFSSRMYPAEWCPTTASPPCCHPSHPSTSTWVDGTLPARD